MDRHACITTLAGGSGVAMSVQEIQRLVREAGAAGTPLRISGRAHWMDAGRPVHAGRIATLATHTGVADYVPGDLTITVRSGTTLRELARITAKEGQYLPLDPHGSEDGTIGATVATGSFGPLAHGFGGIRDLILGAEFVTGVGSVVRGGGRVVKNVAGFDLVRMITGSWGTLGIVTEVTLRLYSLPPNPATIAVRVPDERRLGERIAAILAAPAVPHAVELVDSATARHCGLAPRTAILIHLGGNTASVAAQLQAFASLGAVEVPTSIWSRFRIADDGAAAVIRLSVLPARIAELWNNTRNVLAATEGAMTQASAGLGIVRCILPAPAAASAELLSRLISSTERCTVIPERLPAAAWTSLAPTFVSDRLSLGIKRAFDPSGILNPGILGAMA
ncbi:MAG: FAD-binding oxidoreductase [Gemmatimonadaceae bacterium]|nr:FAD-binding oxidoreductase [Gemmatimonadaceae bacterium]